jgi:hypothetical protein
VLHHRNVPGSLKLLVVLLAVSGACRSPAGNTVTKPVAVAPPIATELRMANGKPTIFVDGKPMNPMIYSITDAPGGRWSWEEFPRWNIRNFGKSGFKIIQFSIWLEDIWTADGKLDMALVRRQFAAILEEIPDAGTRQRLRWRVTRMAQLGLPGTRTGHGESHDHLLPTVAGEKIWN